MQPLDKDKAEFLHKSIDSWKQDNLLSDELANQLKQSISVRKFDWKQVTIYAFVVAISCAVLSVIVLLADKPLRILIQKFTQITDVGISSILTLFSILFFYIAKYRSKNHPKTPFTNNTILLFAAFLSLAAIVYWSKTLQVFEHNYAFIFALATVLYIGIAIYFTSYICWILATQTLAISYGILLNTFVINHFALSYTILYVVFGLMLLSGLFFIKKIEKLKPFFKTHYIISMLVFFIALWLVSIFGNYNDIDKWNEVKQYHFIGWSIFLFAVSLLAMYIGLKQNDHILGNIGLVFFILNLVTRYFEFFWIPLHKSIFFMILAFIFWFIGSRAEKLWNLKFLEEKHQN
jgi:hypothetical protein